MNRINLKFMEKQPWSLFPSPKGWQIIVQINGVAILPLFGLLFPSLKGWQIIAQG